MLVTLNDKPMLVHFWGTWCSVCRLMDGAIACIAEDHAVVSVAMHRVMHWAMQPRCALIWMRTAMRFWR
ncbi:Thioredoxin-like protein [Thiorhodovibrio winogradskyi]|uniref:Thioredoxin-like protein n=1 Tax=Thiorhodovibrio winogradskyi TaxID=77007 RepID=A0ABZ0SF63_9GAMM|nr:thioredoxin domain-containing protein [Thiorhodovibrio winogradskyi]